MYEDPNKNKQTYNIRRQGFEVRSGGGGGVMTFVLMYIQVRNWRRQDASTTRAFESHMTRHARD